MMQYVTEERNKSQSVHDKLSNSILEEIQTLGSQIGIQQLDKTYSLLSIDFEAQNEVNHDNFSYPYVC